MIYKVEIEDISIEFDDTKLIQKQPEIIQTLFKDHIRNKNKEYPIDIQIANGCLVLYKTGRILFNKQ